MIGDNDNHNDVMKIFNLLEIENKGLIINTKYSIIVLDNISNMNRCVICI